MFICHWLDRVPFFIIHVTTFSIYLFRDTLTIPSYFNNDFVLDFFTRHLYDLKFRKVLKKKRKEQNKKGKQYGEMIHKVRGF